MKQAARQAQIGRAVEQLLTSNGVHSGASVSMRPDEDGIRVMIVLAEQESIASDMLKQLENDVRNLDHVADVTIVQTAHRQSSATVAQTSAHPPQRSAHDNPLTLPNTAPPKLRSPEKDAKVRPGNASKTLAVASGKGGVGKSTVAANLAVALAATGQRVGLLDLDIYGPSLPVLFGLNDVKPALEDGMIVPLEAHGVALMSIGFLVDEAQAVAWRGPMVMGAAKQLIGEVKWPDLDWLIIDTPPGTGDAHLTLLQRTLIDGALIVSTPSPLALADVRRGASLFRKMNTPVLGIVENMSSLPDGSRPFGNGIPQDELTALDLQVLTSLPLSPDIGALLDEPEKPIPQPFRDLADMVGTLIVPVDPSSMAP